MNNEQKQIDLFSRIERIDFKDTDVVTFPCACVIVRADRVEVNVGTGGTNLEAFLNALESMAYSLDYPHAVSFLLKLCDPLPQVDESTLKAREWQIDSSEVEGRE